jgi:hypothetical protein
MEKSIEGTMNYTQLLKYFRTKKHHSYGHQTVDIGDSVQNYCLAFFVYQGSIRIEDKDAVQKYVSTGWKWEITSVEAITFLCKTVSNAKDLHKLGTLVTCTMKHKENFCSNLSQ